MRKQALKQAIRLCKYAMWDLLDEGKNAGDKEWQKLYGVICYLYLEYEKEAE